MAVVIAVPIMLLATPRGQAREIAKAQAGEIIRLPSNGAGAITIRDRSWARPVTLDLTGANVTAIVLDRVRGLRIRNGTINANGGYGISVRRSAFITVDNVTITGANRGIVLNDVTDSAITNSRFIGMTGDGVDVIGQRILIAGNRCERFNPLPTEHPDCIQGWSQTVPTADVTVTGNTADGKMQGFFFQTSNGVGFDRIRIERNFARISYGNGFVALDARDSAIRWNSGRHSPEFAGKVNARLIGSGTICGNILPDIADSPASKRC